MRSHHDKGRQLKAEQERLKTLVRGGVAALRRPLKLTIMHVEGCIGRKEAQQLAALVRPGGGRRSGGARRRGREEEEEEDEDSDVEERGELLTVRVEPYYHG